MVLYNVGFFVLFVSTKAPLVSRNGNPRSFSPHVPVAVESLPLFLPVVASDATLCADLSVLPAHWLLMGL